MPSAVEECRELSGNCRGILHCLESGHPVNCIEDVHMMCCKSYYVSSYHSDRNNYRCLAQKSNDSVDVDVGGTQLKTTGSGQMQEVTVKRETTQPGIMAQTAAAAYRGQQGGLEEGAARDVSKYCLRFVTHLSFNSSIE